MATEEFKGVQVTPAKVAFLVGIMACVTFGWQVVGYAKTQEIKDVEQDARLDRSDQTREFFMEQFKVNNEKVSKLNDSIVKLTTVMEVEQRLRASASK